MYSFASRIRYSEIDETGRLSIPSLIDYLQDCSTFHSVSVNRGLDHVRESGRAWLLAGWKIEVEELPRFADEILVGTWATSFKGLFAKRNFVVCAADDAQTEHPLVRADSRWFLFDSAAGRPIRIPEDECAPYMTDESLGEPLDMPAMQRHIRAKDEGEPAAPIVVTGAHIDTNHHVNNAQYVSLALGVLPEELTERVRTLDVQYVTAAKLGDTIYPHIHAAEDGATIVTLDGEDGKPYAAVQVA